MSTVCILHKFSNTKYGKGKERKSGVAEKVSIFHPKEIIKRNFGCCYFLFLDDCLQTF